MATIKEDELGLYVVSGGWVVRPSKHNPTKYTVGDDVKTKCYSGSPFHGIGDKAAKRGEYREKWIGCGVDSYNYKKLSFQEQKQKYDWYQEMFGETMDKSRFQDRMDEILEKQKGKI